MALYSYGSSSKAQTTSHGKTEFELLKESHKFLRDEDDGRDESDLTWEEKLASKYYSSLYREFAVCDLKHYKSGNFALRWRTEDEVLSGTGETSCGNARCKHYNNRTTSSKPQGKKPGLTTLELPFAYVEHGESKSALVKVVLCEKCLNKLMWKRRQGKDGELKTELDEEPQQEEEFGGGDGEKSREDRERSKAVRADESRSRRARMDRWNRDRDILGEKKRTSSRSRSPRSHRVRHRSRRRSL